MTNFRILKPIIHRRGSLLTEGVIACIILGVAIGMLVPGLSAIGRQRKAMRFDTFSMIELNNIADVIRTSNPASPDVKVSKWFVQRYADAVFEMEPLSNDVETKDLLDCVRLTIHRPQTEGMPDQKVSVVVWRSQAGATP